MITRILLLLLGVLLLGPLAAATPEERYQAALMVLTKDCGDVCGFGLSENPAEAKALHALWDATQDWTLEYLGAHPDLDPEHIETDLLNRSNSGREAIAPVEMVMLAPDLYAFAAQWVETGNVFLVGKRGGRFAMVWDIRKADTGKFPILKAWRGDGRTVHCQYSEDECCVLSAGVTKLIPDARGRPRFAVRATYAQIAGFTFAKQLSIWAWSGATAVPLFAKRYLHTIEGRAPRFEDRRVTLWPKEEYKTFGAYGCCDGRPVAWTILIGPDGVDDLGERPLFPEIDAIDAVFYRIWQRQPVDNLGTPKALAAMAALVDAHRWSPSPDAVDYTKIDYLDDFSVRPNGANRTVCLALNTVDNALMFDLVQTKQGWNIAGLRMQAKGEKTEVHGRETTTWSEPCPHHGGFRPIWP